MRRVVGISICLPGALHTVASQHISTLHNTSGRHILRYVPAQVKHQVFFHPAYARYCARIRVHNAGRLLTFSVPQRVAFAVTHAALEKVVIMMQGHRDLFTLAASTRFFPCALRGT